VHTQPDANLSWCVRRHRKKDTYKEKMLLQPIKSR
jgi:hypothetical protein